MVPSRLEAAIVAAAVIVAAIPVLAPSARVDAASTQTAGAGANLSASQARRAAVNTGTVPVLRRAPYLTDVSPSTATVNLATDTGTPAPIITWDVAGPGCSAPRHAVSALKVASFSGALSGTTDYQFKAAIAGLTAGTSYCYRVTQGGIDLLGTSVAFSTAPVPGSSGAFRFAVVGDWGVGSADEAAVFTQIAATNPAFLMTVGDNVYNSGSQAEYGDLNGGNAFAPAYLPKVGGGTPIFPAQGNHGFTGYTPYLVNFPQDAVSAASGGTYAAQSYCCAAGTSGTHTYASAWYAFTWGNARFYVLEAAWADGNGGYLGDFTDHWNGPVAGCVPCGQEMTWLQNDLAANASVPLKFAFFHYPLHVDNSNQASDTYLDGTSALEGVLANGGVQMALQRARPPLRAQPATDPGEAAGQLRHGRGRRSARRGQRLQCLRRLRDRQQELLPRSQADVDGAGLPLPRRRGEWRPGHRYADQRARAVLRRSDLYFRGIDRARPPPAPRRT